MKTYNRLITASCILGVVASVYTYYLELSVLANPRFKAYCDFGVRASCTKVLSTSYAKGFGLLAEDSKYNLPNCIYGLLYYLIMIFLTTFDTIRMVEFQRLLSFIALASCLYLAYILIFVLENFCFVCVSVYVLNIFISSVLTKKIQAIKRKNH